MDRIQFLQSILGDDGYYCVAGFKGKQKVHKYYKTLEEVSVTADDFCANGYETYFALGTFMEPNSREQTNVEQVRSLFIDIDYGPHHGGLVQYDTFDESVAALKTFCKDLSLPKPYIVSTGGGIHAYWPLETPLDREEWYPLAYQLKNLCIEHHLYIDTKVTSDCARILRVPGTYNQKTDEKREVKILYAGTTPGSAEFYRSKLGEPLNLRRSYMHKADDEVTKALLNNRQNNYKLLMRKSAMGKGCAQLKYMYEHRAELDYEAWRAALSIPMACEGGEQFIHKISEGHPEYDPAYTEEIARGTAGPYRCETIRDVMAKFGQADVCKECQFWGKIGSPVVLGREVVEANEEDLVVQATPEGTTDGTQFTYTIPKPPRPYFMGKNGGVYKKIKKDDEEFEICVYHNDIYVARRLNDKESGDCIVLRLHLPKDGVREFTIPMSVVSTNDEFRKQLYSRGVVVQKVDELKNYILESVKEMQFNSIADMAHRQFGWVDDTYRQFILGDKKFTRDDSDPTNVKVIVEYNPPTAATGHMFPAFQKKGSLDEWKEAMKFYERPGMELYQYMIGLSFGSIFTKFTPVNAALLHVFSPDSGIGKTTALYAAASIWGDPTKLVLKESDTVNSRMNRAELYNNIIMLMDELTNSSPLDLSNFVYQLTSGSQKNRMAPSANQERVRGEPWNLMAVSTGNTSVVEKMMVLKAVPKGELMRILEVRALKVPGLTKRETDEFSLQILGNYGHAATVYLEAVMKNIDSVIETYKDTQRKMDAKLGLSYQERFYSAQIADAMTGLLIANRIGLTSFDLKKVVKWLQVVVGVALDRSDSLQLDPEQILNNFWAENWNNTLRIKSTMDLRTSSSTSDTEQFVAPDATPRGAFVLRYEYDIKQLYIQTQPLRDWCVKRQIPYEGLMDGLKIGRTQARVVKKRMGKGTHSNPPPVSAVRVDCKGWLDETTERALAEIGSYQNDEHGDTESGRGSTVH
jgi:Domain of unknown function (DUF927)